MPKVLMEKLTQLLKNVYQHPKSTIRAITIASAVVAAVSAQYPTARWTAATVAGLGALKEALSED